jgi:hypothetical protein
MLHFCYWPWLSIGIKFCQPWHLMLCISGFFVCVCKENISSFCLERSARPSSLWTKLPVICFLNVNNNTWYCLTIVLPECILIWNVIIWRLLSSVMWHCVVWVIYTDILGRFTASIFKLEKVAVQKKKTVT